MFSCCKHVCAPKLSILNVWDIFNAVVTVLAVM